ncbi:MAG: hypothetical protein HQ522_10555 [Bacteroidetes bacterium]|nr:hypothetical protein [Bacteroidota bacterium]
MKNLKFLFVSLIVVFFFVSTSVDAQKVSTKWTEYIEFPCPCAGEILTGDVSFHVVENANVIHWNIIGGQLKGATTGKTYNFSRTSTFKLSTGELVLNIRTKGENGLTTYFQIIGEAGLDEYGEYVPLDGANVTWFCK